jgi:UDP-glucose 4-epimerase
MDIYQKRIDIVEKYLEQTGLLTEAGSWFVGKNILVTGGAGAIGSNLIIALSILAGDKGKVVVLDNLSSIKEKNPWNVTPMPNIMFVEGDVRSDVDLKRVFKEDISVVYHLAAFFANQNSVDYPERSADVDILGMIRLLEYSRLARVERFVYASSGCAIYGSYGQMPLKEDFISMHLTTPYQINKMTGEMYCNFYHHPYDFPAVNCRFFNSYGPGEVPGQYRNVIPNFIYWSLQNKPLPITGTGEATRDFTYVLDLVQGLIKGAFHPNAIGENFNLASASEISILTMVQTIKRLTGSTSEIAFKPVRKWDTKMRLLASIEKAEKLIGYKPVMDFETGLLITIDWFRDNQDLIMKLADFKPGMSSAVRNK